MTRLPIPGSDDGTWGVILNEFLSVEHNNDGTLKLRTDSALTKKYEKPSGGIPRSDLSASVQASLDNADAAASGTIPDGSVTNSKIENGAVDNAKVAANANISQSKLNLAITDAEVAPGAGISQSKISGLATALDGKVDENAAITAGTHTKITYDTKGLVTAGADATTADIDDSADRRYVTDAEKTKLGDLSGVNTGDQDLSGYAVTSGHLGQFAATTSAQLAGIISDETGSGALVFGTSPTLTSPTITSPTGLVKADVGLDSVDNTSDATKNAAVATLTNKRITPRVASVASSSAPTPDGDTTDQYNLTSLAANATFGAPSGTPTDGQKLIIRIKDNGSARTLAWNAIYRAVGTTLPTTTVIDKTLYVGFVYNSADSTWDCIATAQEA